MAEYQCPECGSTQLRVDGRADVILGLDGDDGSVCDVISEGDIDSFTGSGDYCGCRQCDWSGDLRDAQNAAEEAAAAEEEENEKGIDPKDRDEGGIV